ncbi:MAG: TetR/AcrR family transcriptional regulator, partial [Bacteroidota bacterium]
AAKKIFTQKGFAGARMQEIADEAKINKSMLHYYFRSKELLFEKILDNSIKLVIPKFLEAIGKNGTIIEKLEELVHTYIDTILENPHMPMFILYELSQNRLDFISKMKAQLDMHNIFSEFLLQITEEQKQGIIKQIPAKHLIINVMSLIIFPFIAKPIFIFSLELPPSDYNQMLVERKEIIMKFLKDALLV